MDNKKAYVYIMFNKRNGTLYTGVTSDLVKRVYEHKNHVVEGFSKRYGTDKLGYYEVTDNILSAIEREKFIKGKKREYKINLIETFNPEWNDLYYDIVQ